MGARARAVLAVLGTLGLVLAAAAAAPASAADRTPVTPTQLFNGYQNCSTDADRPAYVEASLGLVVEGIPSTTDSTDHSLLTARYQVWPVTDPTRTTTVTRGSTTPGSEAVAPLPSEALADGQTYAWQAQTVAGGAASDWSAPCYIRIDNTRPASAPAVSSSNYPPNTWNQGGEPVEFTLDAGGDDDVTGFEFSWRQDFRVLTTTIGDHGVPEPLNPYADTGSFARADAPGGKATVRLIPPDGSVGPVTLWVRGLDRAYNPSAATGYSFLVRSTAPTVTPDVPSPGFGDPVTFTLRPDPGVQSASPVVSYSVETSGGPDGSRTVDVPAEPDGTARVDLTMEGIDGQRVDVTSRSANGWVSPLGSWSVLYDTTPTVTSDGYPENGSGGGTGVPGTFTFTSKLKDVVSYTYFFNDDPEATVAADTTGPDHTASIDWTPPSDGHYDLMVCATTASGVRLETYDYSFTVN